MNPVTGYRMINFLNWLVVHHPEVRGLKALPERQLLRLVDEFERGRLHRDDTSQRQWTEGFRFLYKENFNWEGYDLARRTFEMNYIDEALAACNEALRLHPDNAAAIYIHKGEILEQRYRSEEALATYKQAVRLAPHNADAHIHIGQTLFACQHYEEALAAYNEALRLDSKSLTAYKGKADALTELKRYEGSASCLQSYS